jgi:secondary thiamine-phosphate synthase enzyme
LESVAGWNGSHRKRALAFNAARQFPQGFELLMRQALHSLHIKTRGKGLVEISSEVSLWLRSQNISTGLLTIFCRHTSASLLIQENADPDVQADLENFFEAVAPENNKRYVHQTEGPDDMPAHIRAALSPTQLSIPVASGRLVLGTWQGIYLFEHRRAPHRREVVLHLLGE